MTTVWKCGIWLLLLVAGFAAVANEPAVDEAIRAEIEQLRESGRLSLGEVEIASGELLARFYEGRNFTPAWSGIGTVDELVQLIEATAADGLDPADYHLGEVRRVRARFADACSLMGRI